MTHKKRLEEIQKDLPQIYTALYEEYVHGQSLSPEEASELVLNGYREFQTQAKKVGIIQE
jgi:hypothetical protein